MFKLVCFLLLTVASLFNGVSAAASGVQCETVQLPAEQQICDHPILKHRYGKILEQQEVMRQAGTLSDYELSNWAGSLADCADVHCIDVAFDQWNAIAVKNDANARAEISPVQNNLLEKEQSNVAVERREQAASRRATVSSSPVGPPSIEPVSSMAASSEEKADAKSAPNNKFRLLDGVPAYIKILALCFFLFLLKKMFGRSRVSEVEKTEHDGPNRSSKVQNTHSKHGHARRELELDRRELNRQARAMQVEREHDAQRMKEEKKRQEELEKRRAIEAARELAKCKFCGSSAFGACVGSPHKRHEHFSDGKHCVFCGSTGTGACVSSPFKRHQR